jgi:hypothetical protein
MGFASWAAATASFRTGAAVVGMVCHLASWGVLATGNVPLAAVLHSAGEIGMAMVVAPPGSNPIENAVTTTALLSNPV